MPFEVVVIDKYTFSGLVTFKKASSVGTDMTVPKAAGNLDPVALETSLIGLWGEENTFNQSI